MDQRTLEQIFEPFFTTRLDGNGLGLATVRAIVDEHGGAMNVVSAPGAGSMFEVWLPLASAREYAPRVASSAGSRGHGETIMLIDDATNSAAPERGDRRGARLRAGRLRAGGPGDGRVPVDADAVRCGADQPSRTDRMALELAGVLRYLAPRVPILFAASTDEINADMLTAAGSP